MRLCKLYIDNFVCYDKAYIDFNEFNTALIVGKKENNDDISNGVGKTTIFKAIEYVIFNHSDVTLENIIRDDQDSCSVTIDFVVDEQEYRVTRTRTKKGITDLTLYKRTASVGIDEEVFHSNKNGKLLPLHDPKYWKDISGRRSADTEKDLGKLIKVNIKSFRVFVHFMQDDLSGLTKATPEKRKTILKEALNLGFYSRLEKIAKDKFNLLSKEVDKFRTMIELIGDPDFVLTELDKKISENGLCIAENTAKLSELELLQNSLNAEINKLVNEHSNLEQKLSSLVVKEQTFNAEKLRLEISVKEYTTKKSNIVASAKETACELKKLEKNQEELSKFDFTQIELLTEKISLNKQNITKLELTQKNNLLRIAKLKKPIPQDGECENCRQVISDEHREICQSIINIELGEKNKENINCGKNVENLNSQNYIMQQNINSLASSKQLLEKVINNIEINKKELLDKRTRYDEYVALFEKFTLELSEKNIQLELVVDELKRSSIDDAINIKNKIKVEKNKLYDLSNKIEFCNKELGSLNSIKAVMQHNLEQKNKEKQKKLDYSKILKELENKIEIYPTVIQGFSSTGIPNLIIQNVLDDLQDESNKLLSQLKPGIQLSFSIEKTIEKTGDQADTLDIDYLVNGKKRYYEQLSGAMKLAVTFSLKLGLSFLLQKMAGVDIKFLLLDEIDDSLDKASIDAFADIVKFFQKDFTILVITHNDRLREKFSNAILVEQDSNMVSKAQVVSSW